MTDAPLPPVEEKRRRTRAAWLLLLLLVGIGGVVLGALLFGDDEDQLNVVSQQQADPRPVALAPEAPAAEGLVSRPGAKAASPAPTSTTGTGAAVITTAPAPASGTAGGSGTVTVPGQCGNCEGNKGNGGGNTGGTGPKSLLVSGVVSGNVAPGASVPMTVTVTNVGSRRIDLTSVTGTVTAVSSNGIAGLVACDKTWYSIGSFTGTRSLAKGASTTLTLPVTFDNRAFNQDNCKGATYTYSLTASGQGV